MPPRLAPLPLAAVAAIGLATVIAVPTSAAPRTDAGNAIEVDVVGFVERQGLYDRTGQCVQGETWLQTNRWEFDTGTYRAVTVRRNPASTRIVSTVSPAGGTSTTKGSISDYRTTQSCPPSGDPPQPPPRCTTNAGKMRASILGNQAVSGASPGRLNNIAIWREGGGVQSLMCVGSIDSSIEAFFANVPVYGAGADEGFSVTTSIGPGPGLVIPLDMTERELLSLKGRKRVTRHYSIAGGCGPSDLTSINVFPAPTPPPPNASPVQDGECTVRGSVTVKLRAARGGKSRR